MTGHDAETAAHVDAVLLVCNDGPTRRQLAKVLRHGSFETKTAPDLASARRLVRGQQFAAVLVTDLGEVQLTDGIADLRALTEVPILVVSRNDDEWDKVMVLDAGADDYLTTPYGIDELLARVRACRRRFVRATDAAPVVTSDFSIYVSERRFVMADGTEVSLTETEWRIIEVLVRRPGHLVRRADLLRAVWGPGAVDKPQYLRVYMVSIRRKVEPDPGQPRYFVTVPGLGLRFVMPTVEVQGSA